MLADNWKIRLPDTWIHTPVFCRKIYTDSVPEISISKPQTNNQTLHLFVDGARWEDVEMRGYTDLHSQPSADVASCNPTTPRLQLPQNFFMFPSHFILIGRALDRCGSHEAQIVACQFSWFQDRGNRTLWLLFATAHKRMDKLVDLKD